MFRCWPYLYTYVTYYRLVYLFRHYIRKTIRPIVVLAVLFIEKLPKTRSGKIMRRVLKAMLTSGAIGDLTTLKDEASVEEVKKAIEELKEQLNLS